MSLVTKGMGSNRLITLGGGYSFGWGSYVLSVGAGGGGGNSGDASLWIGPRTDRSKYRLSDYLARRPRRARQVPIASPYNDSAFTDFEFISEATQTGEIVEQPVTTPPVVSPPVVSQPVAPIFTQAIPDTKRMSTKAKVAIAITISIALVTVAYFWRRRNRRHAWQATSGRTIIRNRGKTD